MVAAEEVVCPSFSTGMAIPRAEQFEDACKHGGSLAFGSHAWGLLRFAVSGLGKSERHFEVLSHPRFQAILDVGPQRGS